MCQTWLAVNLRAPESNPLRLAMKAVANARTGSKRGIAAPVDKGRWFSL